MRYKTPINMCIALLIMLIWIVDLQVPLGIAAGVPYIIPIVMCLAFNRYRGMIIVSTIGIVLTVLGYFYSNPPLLATWVPIYNRVMAVVSIAIVTRLCFIIRDYVVRLETTNLDKLEKLTRDLVDSTPDLSQEELNHGEYR